MRKLNQLTLFSTLAMFGCTLSASIATARPLRVQDMMNYQMVSQDARFSRTGGVSVAITNEGSIAIVIARPMAGSARSPVDGIAQQARADIWVQEGPSASLVNITQGAADQSGWWAPRWSPDGSRLAMISTRGDGLPRLWVWTRATNELRRVSAHPVYLLATPEAYSWLNDEELVFAGPHLGAPDQRTTVRTTLQSVPETWRRAEQGDRTVSVASNETPMTSQGEFRAPRVALDLIRGGVDGREATLATDMSVNWVVSPDRRRIAVITSSEGSGPRAVTIMDRTGAVVATSGNLDSVEYADRVGGVLAWSWDGATVAFTARDGGRPETAIFTLRTGDRRAARLAPINDRFRAVRWDGSDRVLWIRGKGEQVPGYDVVSTSGEVISATPFVFWGSATTGAYAEFRDGQLSAVARGSRTAIDACGGAPLSYGPGEFQIPFVGPNRDDVMFAAGEGNHCYFDPISRQSRLIRSPSPQARLLGFNNASQTAIFYELNNGVISLSRSDGPSSQIRPIARLNEYMADVEGGSWRLLSHVASDGQAHAAWLLLPPGQPQGRQVPVVVWIYPSSAFSPSWQPRGQEIDNVSGGLNLQVLAAHGYAVLFPSLPDTSNFATNDPGAGLDVSTLSALDAAIATGAVDPTRAFVAGHSAGGYAVNQILTRTNRFRGGVAIAGVSDLTSFYGEFSAATRYRDDPLADRFRSDQLLEVGQFRLMSTPWSDPERYMRNSPVYHAGEIHTPLLLIHGDLDATVPIQQSEEMYVALRRLERDVTFIRYWGEGHVLDSPANIADMNEQILNWLDRHGGVDRPASAPAQPPGR